jgi:hypothetical protein
MTFIGFYFYFTFYSLFQFFIIAAIQIKIKIKIKTNKNSIKTIIRLVVGGSSDNFHISLSVNQTS